MQEAAGNSLARQDYAGLAVAVLRQMLRVGGHPDDGSKNELVARCVAAYSVADEDGVGAVPRDGAGSDAEDAAGGGVSDAASVPRARLRRRDPLAGVDEKEVMSRRKRPRADDASSESDYAPSDADSGDELGQPPLGAFVLVKCEYPDGDGLDIGKVYGFLSDADGDMVRVKTLRSTKAATTKGWVCGPFLSAGGENQTYWTDSIVVQFERMVSRNRRLRIPDDAIALLKDDPIWGLLA